MTVVMNKVLANSDAGSGESLTLRRYLSYVRKSGSCGSPDLDAEATSLIGSETQRPFFSHEPLLDSPRMSHIRRSVPRNCTSGPLPANA